METKEGQSILYALSLSLSLGWTLQRGKNVFNSVRHRLGSPSVPSFRAAHPLQSASQLARLLRHGAQHMLTSAGVTNGGTIVSKLSCAHSSTQLSFAAYTVPSQAASVAAAASAPTAAAAATSYSLRDPRHHHR